MTLIMYLNDVTEGGETRFSRRSILESKAYAKIKDAEFFAKMAKKKPGKKLMQKIKQSSSAKSTVDATMPTPAEVQLDVSPKEGMAVVFFPPDPKSRHEGRPVISHKWIAQQWVRFDPIPDGTTPPSAMVSGKR